MSPLISLVITVHNRERYLSDAIESVLTQTYSDFELLIWDDGSTDDSIEIAQHYAAQDKRIRIVAAPHQGRAPALKAAMAEATGAYVGWVDSDDLLAQTALAETVTVLDQYPEIGLVYTNCFVIDEHSVVTGEGVRSQIPYSKERMLTDFITFHFRLMHRSIYQQAGGINEEFVCCQDYDLCLRISEITEIFHLQKPLYYYRRHKESISGQKQIEQILWSKKAVEQALQRRGMANDYELEIEVFTRCRLSRKQKTNLPKSVQPEEFTNWALTPQVLQWLAQFIYENHIRSIVECGSGLSTLLFGNLQLERVLSLEHDRYWYHYTHGKLRDKAILDCIDLRLCPLQPVNLNGRSIDWYDMSQIQPFSAELILVDGPPAVRGTLARYPAPHLLEGFIQPGTWLLLDDYHRMQEQETVALWLEEFSGLELVQVLPFEKELAVLRFN